MRLFYYVHVFVNTHIRNGLSHDNYTAGCICQKVVKAKTRCTSTIFHCKAHPAELQNAFQWYINTNNMMTTEFIPNTSICLANLH